MKPWVALMVGLVLAVAFGIVGSFIAMAFGAFITPFGQIAFLLVASVGFGFVVQRLRPIRG